MRSCKSAAMELSCDIDMITLLKLPGYFPIGCARSYWKALQNEQAGSPFLDMNFSGLATMTHLMFESTILRMHEP